VIMQYESGDNETVDRRVKQIKKAYKDLIKDSAYSNDKAILEVLQLMSKSETKKFNAKLEQKIKNTVRHISTENQQTTHVIDYLKWLAPKVGLDANKLMADK
jgi:ferritin-like metal-binding protein YciE